MTKQQKSMLVKVLGLIIAMLWAALWIFLGFTQSMGETIWKNVVPGFVFFITTLLAFKWELACGVVLITESLTAAITYIIAVTDVFSAVTTVVTISILSLPPLIAGVLLILAWRWKRILSAASE